MNATLATLEGNPLYDAWRELVDTSLGMGGDYRSEGGDLDRWLERVRAPGYVSPHQTRRDLCARYAWSIPDDLTLTRLAKLTPIVECGAGTGYWAALLTRYGADVVAFDRRPPGTDAGLANTWHPADKAAVWHPVAEADSVAAGQHRDRTLLLCWPPYSDPMAYEALVSYELAGGRRVISVGEPGEGCTGDERYYQRLGTSWELTDGWPNPTWPGIHDYVEVWTR